MKRGWFSIALFAVAEIGFGALTYYFANHAANPCIYQSQRYEVRGSQMRNPSSAIRQIRRRSRRCRYLKI